MNRIPLFLTLCLLLVATLSISQAQSHSSNAPKSRALLVGINQYAQPYVPKTPGAEEDALATRDFLKQQYGFRDDEIRLLLREQATAANIVSNFRQWLIAETSPGDRVFFLYAGHGTRVPDRDGDEADGYDEALAPYDVAAQSGEDYLNVIKDDDLGPLMAQLSGRRAVLLFDSCHSGTISRDLGGGQSAAEILPRYLPEPAELVRQRAAGTRSLSGADDAAQKETDARLLRQRDLKLVDEKAVGQTAGLVIFTAAQSGQSAYPFRAGGGLRGALTYVFAEVQRDRKQSLRQLRAAISQRIAEMQKNKTLSGQQQPDCEVKSSFPLDDLPLFADALSVPAIALANPQSVVKLSLQTREGKTVYRFGETVSYQFNTDTPGYLYLLVFSEGNIAHCTFPNATLSDNRLEAGNHLITSDGKDGFLVGEPEGKDVVVALLSATKLNLGGQREEYTWSEVFEILKDRRFSEFMKTRGQSAQKPAALTNWQAASLVLQAVK